MLKKVVSLLLALTSLLSMMMAGCAAGKQAEIVRTFEETPPERTEEYAESHQEITLMAYYELSDGTWETDQHTYLYRLVVSGRPNQAEAEITYTILSNMEDISFEQAWKASGLSSDISDSINPEEAVLVAIQTE